jgi:cytochrome b6-f complex iron-sulfur subunit
MVERWRRFPLTNPDTTATATGRSRREALCGLAVAVLTPGVLAACGSKSKAGTGTSGDSAEHPDGHVGAPGDAPAGPLAKVSDVPVGGGKVVDGPGGKTLLLRPNDGEVTAVSAVCPHAGAIVNPPRNGVITCPLHGSKFDAATGALRGGPATEGLKAVPVTVKGDEVVAS